MKYYINFLISFLFLIIITNAVQAQNRTPEAYWNLIQKTARTEFGGLDLNPVLKTGYQFAGDYEGPNVSLQVDLPLWSKKRRIENREQAVKFLAAGSELVKKLQTAEDTLNLLKEQSRILKAIMSEEGVEGVKALFESEKQVIEQQAVILQNQRDLESMITPLASSNNHNQFKPVKGVQTQ